MPKWNVVWRPCAPPRRVKRIDAVRRAEEDRDREEDRARAAKRSKTKERERTRAHEAASRQGRGRGRTRRARSRSCRQGCRGRGRARPMCWARVPARPRRRLLRPSRRRTAPRSTLRAADRRCARPCRGQAGPGPRKTDRETRRRANAAPSARQADDARRAGKLTLNDALAGEGGRTASAWPR